MKIVDWVVRGDAFIAGVIYGLSNDWDGQKAIEFATAASAIKHTIPGDVNISNEDEILEIAEGNLFERVKR
ncbi:MAG: PfkB family carbohydrate kinase [Cyclobacteriaceae bacterium]